MVAKGREIIADEKAREAANKGAERYLRAEALRKANQARIEALEADQAQTELEIAALRKGDL